MRSRLISGPVWVHMTFSGLVFGVLTTARLVLQDLAWDEAVLAGVVQGAFFGLVFGWWSHRQAEQGRAVLDALPSARRREAVRAASRGPAPVDPGGFVTSRRSCAANGRWDRWSCSGSCP